MDGPSIPIEVNAPSFNNKANEGEKTNDHTNQQHRLDNQVILFSFDNILYNGYPFQSENNTKANEPSFSLTKNGKQSESIAEEDDLHIIQEKYNARIQGGNCC